VVIGNPSAAQSPEHVMPANNYAADRDAAPPPVNCPCHGPSCRSAPRPFAAPVAPVPRLERVSESWAKLGGDELCLARALGRKSSANFDLISLLPGWYPAPWRPPEVL